MRLYHGSNVVVEKPIIKSNLYIWIAFWMKSGASWA